MPAAQPPATPAPEPAPQPTKRPRARMAFPSLHAVTGAIPALSLGIGFWLLIFHEVPKGNSEIVLAIGSGLLGYLTHAVQTKAAKGADRDS